MLAKKAIESVTILETNEDNGSDGGTNCDNFTFPPAQNKSVNSFLYFNPIQYEQTIDISAIVTDLSVT